LEFLHASERNSLSFRNIETQPKKRIKPLIIAMASVKVDTSPGMTLMDMI
jgi:hypothetical protein